MIPTPLRMLIKLGIPLERSFDYEACLEKKIVEVLQTKGKKAARKYIFGEALGLTALTIRRSIRYVFWFF
jgi:hypothetical protein